VNPEDTTRNTFHLKPSLDAYGMRPTRSSHVQYGGRFPVCLGGPGCEVFHGDGIHENSRRWHRDADVRRVLGPYYFPLTQELDGLRERTVRASSVVENLNSRLRGYFFLRRQLGNEYLGLLQFFLNHRRFFRSEHPERVDKSPTELLTGESHPHWVKLLGFTRFSRT
jgi:hypothetical protein